MRNMTKTIGGILLALALLLSMGVTAFAYTRIDTDGETSLTLEYVSGSTPLPGADFQIYKVAEISETNRYTMTEDFEEYSVSLENLDSEGWLDLAATLAAYVARDKDTLTPTDKGVTGTDGTLRFDGLTVGLYLVVGDPVVTENYTYTSTPFLVSLPNLDTETDEWEYDVTAEIKYDREDNGNGTTYRSVIKVWKDDNGENQPKSVTVQLLRNGEVYSEVVLSEENNWKYTWESLPDGYNWQLAEKDVPDGYTVSVSQDGMTFTVTNTYTSDEPDKPDEPDEPDNPNTPDNPDDPDEPDNPDNPDNPDQPDQPDNPDNPDDPDQPDEPDIPQTGQLWWPVPLLAGGGLALFAAGWWLVFLKRKNDA